MKPAEKIERLVKHVSFKASPEMDEHLRADITRASGLRRTGELVPDEKSIRRPIMRVSLRRIIIAALMGTGVVAAAAVGVKYRYMGTDEKGRARVLSEDGGHAMVLSQKYAGKPEEAVKRAEEMDRVIQQGERELVSVREIEVNGQLDSRWLGYEYTLDGRKATKGEYDPATGRGTLVGERLDEARRLWHQVLAGSEDVSASDEDHRFVTAEGEDIPTYERVVQGRVFSFQKVQLVLSDGTKVAWSMGRLREDSPSAPATGSGKPTEAEPSARDLGEIETLRQQDRRQLIGVDVLTANGTLDRRVFVYLYQLADGRTVDMREWAGGEIALSKAQRQEWARCREAGPGEDLGTYEEEVLGRTFAFTRQRYVLSDGTELIWSLGKPENAP